MQKVQHQAIVAYIENLSKRVARLYNALHIRMKLLDNFEVSRNATDPVAYLEHSVIVHKIECLNREVGEGDV